MFKTHSLTQGIGLLAGLGTTFSFMPQVFRVYRTTDINGLSPVMMGIHAAGVSSWIVYGVLRKDGYVIGFNILTLVMLTLITSRYFYIKNFSLSLSLSLPTTGASTSTTPGPNVTGSVRDWLEVRIDSGDGSS